MSKKARKRMDGQQAAPTRKQQQESETSRNKREFIKSMVKADRLVFFLVNNVF